MNKKSPFHPEKRICPSCGSNELDIFYYVADVPVHSVVLIKSKKEALNFPRGDITLGYCEKCGFISNLAFDPTLQDYAHEYEATQGYSTTFNNFNRQLAEKLIERYGLIGKQIIEIGCGQGEFLALLCEDGKNTGLGFDPAYEPQRQLMPLPAGVQIIPDYYSEKYASHQADFICCKMTLEHIHPAFDFVSMIRRSNGEQYDSIVFFQIPNARYVFGDLAFWDVYYEHCSYFTRGALARLFIRAGFEVLELWTDYDDQYLMIEARPSKWRSGSLPTLGDDLQETALEIQRFSELVPQKKEQWQKQMRELHANGQKIVLWGGGSKAVAFLTSLELKPDLVDYVVDINPNKTGTYLPGSGQQIIHPDQLQQIRPEVVIIMNPVYRREIQNVLENIGLRPKILTVADI